MTSTYSLWLMLSPRRLPGVVGQIIATVLTVNWSCQLYLGRVQSLHSGAPSSISGFVTLPLPRSPGPGLRCGFRMG